MLSDSYVNNDECESSSKLSKQLEKLEELSVTMTKLIENGSSEKILHLEKMRQKILRDIIKQKESISENLKPKISNIFFLNDEMLKKAHEVKTKSLSNIKKKVKFYKSYREF